MSRRIALALCLLARAGGPAPPSWQRGAPGPLQPAVAPPRLLATPPPGLPVHAVPSARGLRLALLLTGDDGWVSRNVLLADSLAAHDIGVVALDVRAYLAQPRTPRRSAQDAELILRDYAGRWARPRIILIGADHGADLLPFIANRMSGDLRSRVDAIVLVDVARRASFTYHWTDLVASRHRPTDLPVLPELERLRGLHMLCIYRSAGHDSPCPSLDTTLVRPARREKPTSPARDAADIMRKVLGILP